MSGQSFGEVMAISAVALRHCVFLKVSLRDSAQFPNARLHIRAKQGEPRVLV